MKNKYLSIILCVFFTAAFSQENAYSSFDVSLNNSIRLNRFLINPSFSYAREIAPTINLVNKRQWVKFEDAPVLYLINYQGRLSNESRFAIGGYSQSIGISKNTGGFLNYALNVPLQKDANFTFGLNAYFSSSNIDINRAITESPEPLFENLSATNIITIKPGINLNFNSFDIGIAADNIISYNLTTSESVQENKSSSFSGHVMYTKELDSYYNLLDGANLSTMVRVKSSNGATGIGGNFLLDQKEMGWVEAGYNTLYGANAGVGVAISNKFLIGYAYNLSINNSLFFGSSHEFSLSYRFDEYDNAFDYRKRAQKIRERNAKKKGAVNTTFAKLEQERIDKAKAERERVAKEKAENDRLAQLERERLAALAQAEKERLAREQAEKDRLAALSQADQAEKDRLAALAQAEKDRLAKEQAERDRLAALAQAEKDRLAKEKAEKDRLERLARQKAENDKIAKENAEIDRLAKEKAEQDRLAREKAEKDRLAREQAERDRIAKEEAEKLRLAKDQAERDRLAKEAAERDRLAKEKAEQDRLAREKAEQDRLAREKAERDRLAKEKAEQDRLAREKAEQDRLAREKAEQDRLAREKAEQDRLAKEKAEQDRLAREKAEQDRLAKEKAEQDRLAREKAEQDRLAREKAEQDRLAREKAEQDRLAREKAEQDRLAREKAEQDRLAREKAEQDRLAREKAEQDRLAREKAANAKLSVGEKISSIESKLNISNKLLDDYKSDIDERTKKSDQLIKSLDSIVKERDLDLKAYIGESDPNYKGPASKFVSTTQQNAQLNALKSQIAANKRVFDDLIFDFENANRARLNEMKEKGLDNEETKQLNDYYQNVLDDLKNKKQKYIDLEKMADLKIKQISDAKEEEKQRRIKKAQFDSEQQRIEKDQSNLENIKNSASNGQTQGQEVSGNLLDDEPVTNDIPIVQKMNNVASGYYMVLGKFKDTKQRDAFIKKVVSEGGTSVNQFYNIYDATYYVFLGKYDELGSATKELSKRGTKSYNKKMKIVQVQ
ncbi:PorP/SprF family type IX secretion system membrane protein [Flavobacterium profundi]|uniref:PorP/SprF family type IX secretion system membrane protein n=1 Tax=Flavobacterium profundi TaxID=1774945 RepID=UPI0012FA6DCF|nr:PorP/SprF family type IX secretion system membrane protein [Flavobacterium profundi]